MADPTIEFNFITFEDVRTARYSSARINRSLLRNRILFAQTNQGNLAKFQVQSADDLRITRLTVYGPDGCIIKTATNVTIRSSWSCDLDRGRESSTAADFWWNAEAPGVCYLEPRNAARFHLYVGFDDIGFGDVRSAEFVNRRVERSALREQVLFCRTSRGRFAKLLVEAADTLIVRRLIVYDADGTVHLDATNISVPRTYTLDVDSGSVGASGYDLWWEVDGPTSYFLTPDNGARISFASYFRFEKYLPFLRSAAIRAAMVYVNASGTRAYDTWSNEERLQLREFLYMRETGVEPASAGPPPLTDDHYISACSAWKIYLAHVAQSLWIDAGARVPWRVAAANADALAHLFDMRKLLSFSERGHSFETATMGAVTDWNPSSTYAFLVDEGLIRADAWRTIQAVAEWCRAHLRHIADFATDRDGGPFSSWADQMEYIFGYRWLPPVDRMIHPLPARQHVTTGCWGTDGFLAAVLRTVNIPVRHGRSNLNGLHSRAEFFTVGRNLGHGDDPYNGWVANGFNNVPIDRIFRTNAQIAAEIDSPVPLPGRTVAETASFNHERRLVALGVEFKTDYLLRLRCNDRGSGAVGTASQVWQTLHRFFTDAQIEAIVIDCDAAIAAIPDGCGAF